MLAENTLKVGCWHQLCEKWPERILRCIMRAAASPNWNRAERWTAWRVYCCSACGLQWQHLDRDCFREAMLFRERCWSTDNTKGPDQFLAVQNQAGQSEHAPHGQSRRVYFFERLGCKDKTCLQIKIVTLFIFSTAKLKTVMLGEAEWCTASAWSWSQWSYGKHYCSF